MTLCEGLSEEYVIVSMAYAAFVHSRTFGTMPMLLLNSQIDKPLRVEVFVVPSLGPLQDVCLSDYHSEFLSPHLTCKREICNNKFCIS